MRVSTTTSSTAPRTHVTIFAWPGGVRVPWMPRRVPRRELEKFTCATGKGRPVTSTARL